MRLGCQQCAAFQAGYILPVMTRRGLRGVPSRGGLRGLGRLAQDEVPSGFLFPSVADVMTQPGAPFLAPDTALPGSAQINQQATNAQGQTMADILAAGGNPADLGPTYDTSQTGASIAPTMQTSDTGYVYSAAAGAADSAYTAVGGAMAGAAGAIPWWIWMAAGGAGLILLVRSVK